MNVTSVVREACIVLLISILLGLLYGVTFRGGIVAASGRGANESPAGTEVPAAPAMIPFEEAYGHVRSGNAVFIDARNEAAFALGHIDNALNIPVREFEQHAHVLTIIPRDTLLITYCDGGGCNASIELAARLTATGFRNVRIFHGGWQEWETRIMPAEHSNNE